MTRHNNPRRFRERLLIDECEYLLENARRELGQQTVHVRGVDRRLITVECILRDGMVTATVETRALEAKLTALRAQLDAVLEPECERLAQAWMARMREVPLCKLEPKLRLVKREEN
jgi:hypothetical protein